MIKDTRSQRLINVIFSVFRFYSLRVTWHFSLYQNNYIIIGLVKLFVYNMATLIIRNGEFI